MRSCAGLSPLPLLATDAGTAFGTKAAVRPRDGRTQRRASGPEPGAESERRGGGGGGAGEGGGGGGGGRGRRRRWRRRRGEGAREALLTLPSPRTLPRDLGPARPRSAGGEVGSWRGRGKRRRRGAWLPAPSSPRVGRSPAGLPRVPAAGRLVGSPPGLAERRSRPRKVVGPVIELSNGCSCRPKMAGQGGERGGGGGKHETNTAKGRARRAERAAPAERGRKGTPRAVSGRCPRAGGALSTCSTRRAALRTALTKARELPGGSVRGCPALRCAPLLTAAARLTLCSPLCGARPLRSRFHVGDFYVKWRPRPSPGFGCLFVA